MLSRNLVCGLDLICGELCEAAELAHATPSVEERTNAGEVVAREEDALPIHVAVQAVHLIWMAAVLVDS